MVLCICGRGLGGMEGNSGSQLGGGQLLTQQGGPKNLVGGDRGEEEQNFPYFFVFWRQKGREILSVKKLILC